jgi:hypothetical protein
MAQPDDELVDLKVVIPKWMFMEWCLEAEEQGMLIAELAGLRLVGWELERRIKADDGD